MFLIDKQESAQNESSSFQREMNVLSKSGGRTQASLSLVDDLLNGYQYNMKLLEWERNKAPHWLGLMMNLNSPE